MTTDLDLDSALTARLEAALQTASHSPSQLISITLPAPPIEPSRAFVLHSEEPGYYFATADQGGDVGIGSAFRLEEPHAEAISRLETEAQELLEHAILIGIDSAARAPKFYGGVPFDRSLNGENPWGDFSAVRFELPRFRYLSDGKRASLTLHVHRREIGQVSEREAWRTRTHALLSSLRQPPIEENPSCHIQHRRDFPDAQSWVERVEAARAAIHRGSLEKVVLAREITLELDSAPSVSALLDNLRRLSPGTTRFAFRKGGSTFLGATPERLVSRLGSELRTEAVAGSVRAVNSDTAMHLMTNEKERLEHALVVREIVRKLELMGTKPEVPAHPSVRQVRHVLHLATTITARFFGPPHVLTIMSRLHPTPAVAGVPERGALEFIRQHEGFDRGWYAAPVGWFDAQGDGEFVVGLRSGLLKGNVLRLYAGAGIVRDSQPRQELEETDLKLQNLLDALERLPRMQA